MILSLSPIQRKEFLKLKRAYAACLKSGIYFVNNYGTLEAYDGSIVAEYSDSSSLSKTDPYVVSTHDAYCSDTMKIANELTDDEHLIKLTDKGVKQLLIQ